MTKPMMTNIHAPELVDVPAPVVTEAFKVDTRTIEERVAEIFAHDVRDHQMTILHDDGLYRHLRFRRPESSFSWFDLITWPGNLAIKGDHGGYMFCRLDDMFQFFRSNGNSHGINPGYWAEKLPDYGQSVKEYSEEVLKANIEDLLPEYAEEYPDRLAEYLETKARYEALPWPAIITAKRPIEPKSLAEIRELIAEYDDNGELSHEEGARELLRELERAGVVSDTWEWNLSDWNYRYLWCCHAIVWGIAQYDAEQAEAGA